MGNQPSSEKGKKGEKGADGVPMGREYYRSFERSDTQGSTRSLRNSIRNKIPGTGKTDSPRNSVSNVSEITNGMDAVSLKSEKSKGGRGSRRGSTASDGAGLVETAVQVEQQPDEPQPPPSPVHGATVGTGQHDAVEKAQQTGEVDRVSEVPPSGVPPPSASAQPGESILQKKGQPIPRLPEPPAANDGAGSPMEISALKAIDLDDMIQRLLDAAYAGKVTKTVCLKNAEIFAICSAAREVLLSQPALLELAPPVKIVGDIHGQYTDLIRMFEMCGFPPNSNYLFLGDYVDRGKQSLETILLLMCYKLKFPENFFLLRGNHECANVTRVYGFYDECKRRTNIKVWKAFVDTFNCLPIAAIVAQKIFCVHGGLSPSLSHMDDIRQIARPTDVPDYGLLNDLLWSDPADMENDWESNERGVSYCFGKKVIMEFLQRHDFDLVCRAHMVVEDGYEFFNDRVLVTVFSAPNYCGEFDNWGAVMSVSGELLCSFELLKPLDSSALKSHIKKSRNKRQSMLNSPDSESDGPPEAIFSPDNSLQDSKCDGLVEKFKNTDKQRCPPGLRRKSALDQLSGLEESEETRRLRKTDRSTPPAPYTYLGPPVRSLLAPLEIPDMDHEEDHWQLKKKRTSWESSLPTDFERHPNHVIPGHTLEYVTQGVPAPRKKPEDFKVSTKHKRRPSSR